MNGLQILGITKKYRNGTSERCVLDNLSFTVEPGEWVSIIGKSGSGKTTLLRCVSGLIPFDSGEVLLDGLSIGEQTADSLAVLRRTKLGFVFQDYNLLDELTVEQNVAIPLLLNSCMDEEVIRKSLEKVAISDLANQRAKFLSGGEKQRVAIARTLAQKPHILFVDEPTGALDSVNGQRVLDQFRLLTDEGISILMVTHDLDAAALADRAIILRDGHIMGEYSTPTPSQLYSALGKGEE